MAPSQTLPQLACGSCGGQFYVRELLWRCPCGGLLDIAEVWQPELTIAPNEQANSLWRYQSVLPIQRNESISMGEGDTPIVRSRTLPRVRLKLEFLSPTMSFKDRGAVVLATLAAHIGVDSALVDSSGNAGIAAAAYFARARIACEVLVPASTSAGKLAQIEAYSAKVTVIEGSRADTATAAMRIADRGDVFYASHVYHPYFLHGVKTYGYEIWEQNGRTLPSAVMVPVGNGTLLLGCYLAFTELVATGLADRLPALLAVQATNCAPLAAAFQRGADTVADGELVPTQAIKVVPTEAIEVVPTEAIEVVPTEAIEVVPTVAEGIAIAAPPRARQILAAVRATGGTIVTVEDDEIMAARRQLASEGLFVEPTASVCFAAAVTGRLEAADDVVIALCGAGARGAALRGDDAGHLGL